MIGKYIEFDHYLEILRDHHRTSFTFENINNSYERVKTRVTLNTPIAIIIERLFEFSIIGFYKPGGGGFGGSEYCFQYASEQQPFNHKAVKYRVHPGFKEYLELIE